MNSCIDLLFTDMTNKCPTSILDVNITDHQFIHITRKHCQKPKSKLDFSGRSYKNYDHARFCDMLSRINWDELYQCNDVNIAWNIVLSNITTVVDIMCRLKMYKVAQAKELWITNETLELIKDKDCPNVTMFTPRFLYYCIILIIIY